MVTMTTAETELLHTDLPTIHQHETKESAVRPSSDTTDLPEFLKRPGVFEAMRVSVGLRDRFDRLKISAQEKEDEMEQCLQAVQSYEYSYEQFADWLNMQVVKGAERGPLPLISEEMRTQLQAVEVCLHHHRQ